MHDVITIGSGVRDVFLKSDAFQLIKSDKFETGIGECVPFGSKVDVEEIYLTTGGGATNAAVTFARLGFQAAAACRLGSDATADAVMAELEAEGVTTSLMKRAPGEQTGYSTLLTAKNGERSVLVYRGAAAKFTAKDLPLSRCLSKWIYMTSLGGNLTLAKRVIRHARECGALVAWNPGGGEIGKGLKAMRPALRSVRVLMVNKEEAAALTGASRIKDMLDALETEGNIAIITDGSKGAYARQDGRTIRSGTTGAPSISRTGAGDAFGSGLVASLMRGDDIGTALAVGTLNAESVIQSLGAKNGILKRFPGKKTLSRIKIK